MSPSISVRLLATQSDARLADLAARGHERAFEALILRYRRALLAYCSKLLMSDALAEDALQQGLLQAWLALRSGTDVRDPRSWLYRIVHNAALNAQRSAGDTHQELPATLHDPETAEEAARRAVAIRNVFAGLAALPENQREALVRTAVQGQSHDQVATALGLSDESVRGLVYRARAAMRAAVTAVTPPPLINWVLSSAAGGGTPVPGIPELSAGGASIGLGGLLLKGSLVAASAGAIAGSIVVTTPHGGHSQHIHAARFRHVAAAPAQSAALPARNPTTVELAAALPPRDTVPQLSRRGGGRAGSTPGLTPRPSSMGALARHKVADRGSDDRPDHRRPQGVAPFTNAGGGGRSRGASGDGGSRRPSNESGGHGSSPPPTNDTATATPVNPGGGESGSHAGDAKRSSESGDGGGSAGGQPVVAGGVNESTDRGEAGTSAQRDSSDGSGSSVSGGGGASVQPASSDDGNGSSGLAASGATAQQGSDGGSGGAPPPSVGSTGDSGTSSGASGGGTSGGAPPAGANDDGGGGGLQSGSSGTGGG